ncbi:kinase-like domain-containing protein [Apodospora peruviana]|uniref:Kinase-like domain-containing protein n=1 Tax=Apodospora peruviana TaxID=516989 RepID=A0AAE0IRJ4_9PEZI|nr:kinase-like domain-containing protein [Apodospora peruviana]
MPPTVPLESRPSNDVEQTPSRITFLMYDDQSGIIQPHEPLEGYEPGGFHPVALGDTFPSSRLGQNTGRYTIRHKLGFGGYSTVWLAWDDRDRVWVSVKIKKASASTPKLDEDPEISISFELERHYVSGLQDKPRWFVRPLDSFQHIGVNGTHNCLVTELLGPTVSKVVRTYNEVDETLRPDTILRASRQLLEGLAITHEIGYLHGDISPANIAFTCHKTLNHDEYLFDDLGGEPMTADWGSTAIPRPAHLPKHIVKTADWALWYDSPWEDVRLIDWGSAFPVTTTVPADVHGQPFNLQSPETFFIGLLDYKHDLWRAGCVVYTLFYQEYPFRLGGNANHFYICRLIEKLGPLPEAWRAKWIQMVHEAKMGDIDVQNIVPQPILETFEDRLRAIIKTCEEPEDEKRYADDEYSPYDYQALRNIQKVIEGLLRYQPEERVSAKEAAGYIEWNDHRRADSWNEDDGQEEEEHSEEEEEEERKGKEVDDDGESSKDKVKFQFTVALLEDDAGTAERNLEQGGSSSKAKGNLEARKCVAMDSI